MGLKAPLLYKGVRVLDWKLITDVATEPVTKAELKKHLKLDETDTSEDTLLDIYIKAARAYAETVTSRCMAPQTWELILKQFPETDFIKWSKGPLTSITSVKYYDIDNVERTLASTEYVVDADTFPGKIYLHYNKYWPTVSLRPHNGVIIRGVCGYTTLPQAIKNAIMLYAGALYNARDLGVDFKTQRCVDLLLSTGREQKC